MEHIKSYKVFESTGDIAFKGLMNAVKNNNMKLATHMFTKYSDSIDIENDDNILLKTAVSGEKTEMVEMLLANGSDQSEDDNWCIKIADYEGYDNIVELLSSDENYDSGWDMDNNHTFIFMLCDEFEIDKLNITTFDSETYEHFGLTCFDIDSTTYAIGTDLEVDGAIRTCADDYFYDVLEGDINNVGDYYNFIDWDSVETDYIDNDSYHFYDMASENIELDKDYEYLEEIENHLYFIQDESNLFDDRVEAIEELEELISYNDLEDDIIITRVNEDYEGDQIEIYDDNYDESDEDSTDNTFSVVIDSNIDSIKENATEELASTYMENAKKEFRYDEMGWAKGMGLDLKNYFNEREFADHIYEEFAYDRGNILGDANNGEYETSYKGETYYMYEIN